MKGSGWLLLALLAGGRLPAQTRPNIIFILADDMGYGDVSALNDRDNKVSTPHIDQLIANGMNFTDAHTPTAVCTPTRYAILTGRYAWRSKLKSMVLRQYDPPLIEKNRLTVAGLLRKNGYKTAAFGKWHLGWDWPLNTGGTLHNSGSPDAHLRKEESQLDAHIDFSGRIKNGPVDHGFDYYFGVDVPNYPPYCFIENDKLQGLPDTMKPASIYGNHGYTNAGPMKKGWKLENVLPAITQKAVEYIGTNARNSAESPFFIYMALTGPHTSIAPTTEFIGKSMAGLYGDFVQEVDWSVGELVKAVQNAGITDNTIIIFTSDNGSPSRDGEHMEGRLYSDTAYGHYPSYNFRGIKTDIWEGGHRVPFIVSWPGKIKRSRQVATPICSVDLMATCAALVHARLPENAGEDSYSLLPILFGHPRQYGRPFIIHNSGLGFFSIRQGDWKLVMASGSGGWTLPAKAADAAALPSIQLYNMKMDIAEKQNLASKFPARVAAMERMLKESILNGRTTKGPRQENEGSFIPSTVQWISNNTAQ